MRRPLVRSWLAVAATAGIVAAVALGSPSPAGRIDTPKAGQVVPRRIAVAGAVSNVPSWGFVWLVTQRGGMLWPKQPRIAVRNGRWRVVIGEGTALGTRFSLALVVVDRAGSRSIERWLAHGAATGDYPALTAKAIQLKLRLAVVRSLVIRHE